MTPVRRTPRPGSDLSQQDSTPGTSPVKNPYGNIPSLTDIYQQAPSTGTAPLRFGSEAFLLGTGNANDLPSDLPVGPDYVLGPGDQIVINMSGGHSERLTETIDRQGQIALPEAGTLVVNGMTVERAQAAIQKALSAQFQNESVEISLGRVRTVRVYVVGDVQRPGAYDVSSLSTPLSVLYAAGGPTSRGSLRILEQFRGNRMVAKLDLYDFLLKGVRSEVARLEPGDTILVPPAGPQVTVQGMVHHPAIYELNGETTLQQVLDLAGGIKATASLAQITVGRVEPNKRRTMLEINLPNTETGIQNALASFRVQGGDDVIISQILPYNQQAVYVEGHVYRPGRYAYHDGMTLNDLLKSYQDILPEPSDHGEIIRLVAPDYHPVTIPFNLPDVLVGGQSIALHALDTVHVYGRYDQDSPEVSIDGQVLRPGRFPLGKGMTISSLIEMAGGFTRAAFRTTGELVSYTVQNGQRVVLNRTPIDLAQIAAHDASADLALKPGDEVNIRALAGWNDIGSSVTISGEVEHPGSFGITEGERLSSVLLRAGGYRNEAYPMAAVLNRIQVQQLNQQARDQMLERLRNTPVAPSVSIATTAGDAAQQTAAAIAARDRAIAALESRPTTGRLVIDIPGPISAWQGTPADVPMRAGDTLNIPKLPNFVIVAGEVFNPTAISYVPGKRAKDYLLKAGGTTSVADRKRIFILRADGSVIAHGSTFGDSKLMNTRMHPGDTIYVPDKVIGASQTFRDVLAVAQVAAQTALAGAVLGSIL